MPVVAVSANICGETAIHASTATVEQNQEGLIGVKGLQCTAAVVERVLLVVTALLGLCRPGNQGRREQDAEQRRLKSHSMMTLVPRRCEHPLVHVSCECAIGCLSLVPLAGQPRSDL